MKNFIESLEWRCAVKKFDPNKKLNKEQLDYLIKALQLTPTSYGLQAYKFVLVENPEVRKKIQSHAWNQTQVVDASHLFVLCIYDDLTEKHVEDYLKLISKVRGTPMEKLNDYKQMMLGSVNNKTKEKRQVWMACQVYIALGILMSACASLEVDSCPMEGFSPPDVDNDLHLSEKGLKSVLLCPVGFRSADDPYSKQKKVRYPVNDLVIKI